MLRIEDILPKLGKAKFFTTLDLRSDYYHIAIDEDSIKKSTFAHHLVKMNISRYHLV